MARVLKGPHSFTCTPRFHLLMEWTIPAFAFPAKAGTYLLIPKGRKADLALVMLNSLSTDGCSQSGSIGNFQTNVYNNCTSLPTLIAAIVSCSCYETVQRLFTFGDIKHRSYSRWRTEFLIYELSFNTVTAKLQTLRKDQLLTHSILLCCHGITYVGCLINITFTCDSWCCIYLFCFDFSYIKAKCTM